MSAAPAVSLFEPRLERRRLFGRVFAGVCILASLTAVLVLGTLLTQMIATGWTWLDLDFLRNYALTLDPEASGVRAALAGTIWLMVLTTLIAVPVGVGAAIYLEEYAPKTRLNRLIHLNIANLAGVPSIVYGLLGLAVFVRFFVLDRSIIAAALTLSLLSLPVIIIASREALAAVPGSIRAAAFALGATRWQTVRHHVLPAALPGIMTGIILSISRAIGESAPLLIVGGLSWIMAVPGGPISEVRPTPTGVANWVSNAATDRFTALPLQIFYWAERPAPEFAHLAAAAILVLLAILFTMNSLAAGIRAWHQRHRSW